MVNTTVLISDLHLQPERPDITARLTERLRRWRDIDALYILGDLFEAWIGDDTLPPDHPLLVMLREFAAAVPTYFMHGNRDFLVGEQFAESTGITLLTDPTIVRLVGQDVLLTHGDQLCTDDTEYMQFRQMVRNPDWQQAFLAKPLEERIAIAKQARDASQDRNQSLNYLLMDVNKNAVDALMREHGVQTMIHGHTHRPALHRFRLDGDPASRYVLGDWFDQASALYADDKELHLR